MASRAPSARLQGMHHGDESVPSPPWECGTPCPRCQGTPGAMMVAQAVPSWRPHPPVQAQATGFWAMRLAHSARRFWCSHPY